VGPSCGGRGWGACQACLSLAPGGHTSPSGVCHPKASPAKRHGRFGLLSPPGTQTCTFRALQGPPTYVTLPTSRRELQWPDVGAPPSRAGAGFGGPTLRSPFHQRLCAAPVCSCHFSHADWAFPGVQVSQGQRPVPTLSWPDAQRERACMGTGDTGLSQEERMGLLFCVPLSKKVQMMVR